MGGIGGKVNRIEYRILETGDRKARDKIEE